MKAAWYRAGRSNAPLRPTRTTTKMRLYSTSKNKIASIAIILSVAN